MTQAPRKRFMDPPEEAQPFFDAAKEQRLMVQRCTVCGEHQFYPRKLCIACGSPEVELVEVTGQGTVHTFTVVHRGIPGWAEEGPYVAAVIDLQEGVRMTSNVIGCTPAEVTVGMPVQVVFVDEGELVVPRFRPSS